MRYSEDLDFVQIAPSPIGETIDCIRSKLDSWLGQPKRKRSEGRVTLVYRFDSESIPTVPLKLKIEINTREHFSCLGYIEKKFQVDNSWFLGSADVTCFSLEELLGTKLRALYQRKKGRDLYDLFACYKTFSGLDLKSIHNCFVEYMIDILPALKDGDSRDARPQVVQVS